MYYNGYGWYGYGWYDHVVNVWDPQLAVALFFFVVMMYCVWRLCRGMRLDAFERSVRTLRQQPGSRLSVARRSADPTDDAPDRDRNRLERRTGIFQISLLPLMLAASGMAMLLAQAQRPDELSRPVTWALFVAVGSWCGMNTWGRQRGLGPLRNYAWAGSLTGAVISLGLWTFYMAVDSWWIPATAERLTARLPQLLWWTAVGSMVGGLLGAAKAHRRTNQIAVDRVEESAAGEHSIAISATPVPRRSRVGWGGVLVGCAASLLFHLSAAPQLNQVVRLKHYYWWHSSHHPRAASLTLTMQPMQASTAHLALEPVAIKTNTDPIIERLDRLIVWNGPVPASADQSLIEDVRVSYEYNQNVGQVLIPKRNIPQGERLRTEDFQVVDASQQIVKTSGPTQDYVRNVGQVAGRYAANDIRKGQPLNNAAIAADSVSTSSPQSINELLIETEPELRGVLIEDGVDQLTTFAPVDQGGVATVTSPTPLLPTQTDAIDAPVRPARQTVTTQVIDEPPYDSSGDLNIPPIVGSAAVPLVVSSETEELVTGDILRLNAGYSIYDVQIQAGTPSGAASAAPATRGTMELSYLETVRQPRWRFVESEDDLVDDIDGKIIVTNLSPKAAKVGLLKGDIVLDAVKTEASLTLKVKQPNGAVRTVQIPADELVDWVKLTTSIRQ